jgi:hypothetical protein
MRDVHGDGKYKFRRLVHHLLIIPCRLLTIEGGAHMPINGNDDPRDRKPASKRELQWINVWTEEEIVKLQLETVNTFLKCDSQPSVEATVEFAKYLRGSGLTSDNYPLFLALLEEENSNVTDALLGDSNAFDFFKEIQPNYFIINFCFSTLYKYSPGGVYDRTLELIFGIIFRNYHRAREGFWLYPLSIENLNSLGKFLDKSKGQNEGNNRFILDTLADISEYSSQDENEEINQIASHSVAIRNAFFDRRRDLKSVIPEEILVKKNYKETIINPRKARPLGEKIKVKA